MSQRSELRAIARYQQKQEYASSNTTQQLSATNPAVIAVATGLDPNTGRTRLTTLDGGTMQGTSIARSPLPPNSVIPAALGSAIGTILDAR
jgi:hypothetical protein